jgi:UDP-N-acetylmuramoyl-tripeptide--D-alanyl-D-alanine ligase
VSYALLVGEEMAPLVEAMKRDVAWAGKFDHCANGKEAADRLPSRLCADDAVLVKGSNSVGLSKLVEALIHGGS